MRYRTIWWPTFNSLACRKNFHSPPHSKQDSGFFHPHSIWKDLHSSPFCFVQDFHLTFHCHLRLLACKKEEWCTVSVFQNSISKICGNNAIDFFWVRPILSEKMTINYSTWWMLILKSIHKSKITFIHTLLFFFLSHVYCPTSNVQLPLFKRTCAIVRKDLVKREWTSTCRTYIPAMIINLRSQPCTPHLKY